MIEKTIPIDILTVLTEHVKKQNLTVVFPEGRDERIIMVARRLQEEGIARPVVLGRSEQIDIAMKKAGVCLDGIKTVDPKNSDRLDFMPKGTIAGEFRSVSQWHGISLSSHFFLLA